MRAGLVIAFSWSFWLVACSAAGTDAGTCPYACPEPATPTTCVGKPRLGTSSACEVGDPLPGRILSDCCGRLVSLADLVCEARGLVLEFGAGWCKECRESAPTLSEWNATYRDRGLRVVSVLKETDGPGQAATQDFCRCWGSDYDARYTLLMDPADSLTTACSRGSLPTTLVVDASGQIRAQFTGAGSTEIETTFLPLLEP